MALRQEALARNFEHRDAAVRILREELGRARGACLDVDLDQFVGQLQLLEHEAALVAVSGGQVVVESVHSTLQLSCRSCVR